MKFQYSAGLTGYGARGATGLDGSTGAMVYFTNLNPSTNKVDIEERIKCASTLWATYDITDNQALAGNRSYLEGDIFIDRGGLVYSVENVSTGIFTKISDTQLFTDKIFVDTELDTSTATYRRYFNIVDASKDRILIDTVYSENDENYLDILENSKDNKIYNIPIKDFNRIEYSDIKHSLNNVFTVFSSGNDIDEENQCIALICDGNNKFRFGNINKGTDPFFVSTNIRDVNFTFDVSSLVLNKSWVNFNPSREAFRSRDYEILPNDSILTNRDYSNNRFFDGVFVKNPTSFIVSSEDEEVTVSWDLNDFFIGLSNLSGISADLYVAHKTRPLFMAPRFGDTYAVLHDIEEVGTTTFQYVPNGNIYIKLYYNGWSRCSTKKSI